jgi:hypothetical protein
MGVGVAVGVGVGVLVGVAVLIGVVVAVGNGVALGAGVVVGADTGAQADKIMLTSKNTSNVRFILRVLLWRSAAQLVLISTLCFILQDSLSYAMLQPPLTVDSPRSTLLYNEPPVK